MTSPQITNWDQLQDSAGREFVGEWIQIDENRAQQFFHGAYLDRTYGEGLGEGYAEGLIEGFHLLALLDWLSAEIVGRWDGLNYGLNRVRFVSQVLLTDSVRLRIAIADIQPKALGMLVTYDVVLEVAGRDAPGLVAQWLVLLVENAAEVGHLGAGKAGPRSSTQSQ